MLILECLESSFVPSLHLLTGFDFNGYLGVAYDGIHLLMVVGVPVGNLLAPAIVSAICDDFLHDKMLEGVAVVVGASSQMVSPHQVVRQSHIEIVEFWCLHHFTLDCLCICRYLVTHQGVFQNLIIGFDGLCRNAAVARDI